jgi:Ca2+-binding RTX toxin-like protein
MYLDASQTSANVTLIAGSQDAVLVSGAGVDTLIGGTGDDTFSTINAGGGEVDLAGAGAGICDLTGKALDSPMTLDVSQAGANVTLIGNNQGNRYWWAAAATTR